MITKTTVERTGHSPVITTVYNCDRCRAELEVIDATVSTSKMLRTWDGSAAGEVTKQYDLCNTCMDEVLGALNGTF